MSSKTRSGMSASNRRGMVAITIVVLVLLTILFNGSKRLTQKNQGYETKKIELNGTIVIGSLPLRSWSFWLSNRPS